MLAQRLIRSLPEPCVLVRASGTVVAANGAATRVLGDGLAGGVAITELFEDPASVRQHLGQFSRSSSAIPGALSLAGSGARIRCDGALVESGPDPLLLLRLKPGEPASDRFIALNERIGALNREIRERRRAQEQLQEQAIELEQIAAELEQTVEELQQQTEDATAARERAQRSADQLATLAEAGAVLTGADDYAQTLQRLTEVAVRTKADYCIAYIAEADGRIRRVGAHTASGGADVVARLLQDYSFANPGGAVGEAMRSGEPLMVPNITEEMLRAAAVDDENFEILSELAPASTIIMPLPSTNGTLGALTLARGADKPAYTDEDVQVVRELARRAAVAVEHARLLDQAQRGNNAKSAFLATMSHELRTPLNAVVGYADLLDAETSGPLLPEQRQQLSRIQAAARHLRDIIEDILLFARIDAGKEQLRPARVDLAAVIEEVADLMKPAADQRGLRLVADPGTGQLGEIITDASRMRQILLNLVANAVKFTDSGHVRIALRPAGADAVVEVEDTGIGIAAEHQEAIFEPFWQVDSSATREAGGTGLGLTVTQRLVQLLGGELSVSSVPGQGSTFTLHLPPTPPDSA